MAPKNSLSPHPHLRVVTPVAPLSDVLGPTLPPTPAAGDPLAASRPRARRHVRRAGTGEFIGTGRYRVRRRLGAGGFGVVYEAHDTQRGEDVAVKVLRELGGDALYRFKREFRALCDIAHENLVELYELVSDGEHWFFAMELVRGVDFLDYVRPRGGDETEHRARGLDARRLRAALRQLARGVAALHAADKLHCDIKPSNVLVDDSSRVKLLDFGLITESQLARRSITDAVCGTVEYMAPEQALGETVTASDWYAVGAILYEALSVTLPFGGPPLAVLTEKQRVAAPPPPRAVPAELEDLGELCLELLAREPRSRPSGDEILSRLGALDSRPLPRVISREVPSAAHGLGERAFVGRAAELQALRDAYETMRLSERAVIANVYGTSGMGKTTLVRRFLDELGRDTDAVVLRGRCYEHESVPYKSVDSLIDSLCRFLRRLPRVEAERLMPRDVRALARLFPVLDRVDAVAQAPLLRGGDDDERSLRRRAFSALRELFGRINDRHPLVLWIDDVQWSDRDSRVLLGDLIGGVDAPAFLLVASFRSAAQRPTRLPTPDAAIVRDIAVTPLPAADATELAERMLADAFAAHEVDDHDDVSSPEVLAASGIDAGRVALETQGVPFLICAVAQHLARSGEVGEVRLDDVVVAQLSTLPAGARALLEVLSLAGRPIRQDVAAAAAGLHAAGSDAATLLARYRLAQTRGCHWPVIETCHDRIREAVVEALAPQAKRLWHRRIAVALEAAGEHDPEALLQHFAGAGDVERAASQAVIAAQRATAQLAFDQAVRMYRTALELTPQTGLQRAALREKLGLALANAGKSAEAARELLAAAADSSDKHGRALEGRAAEQLILAGHVDEGVAILQRLCETDGRKIHIRPRRAVAAFVWGQAKLFLRGMDYTPTAEADVPPQLLRRVDSALTLAAGIGMVNPASGAMWATRALLLALKAGEPGRISQALAYEVGIRAALGWGGTRRLLERANEAAEQVDSVAVRGKVAFAHGVADYFEGRFTSSLAHLREADVHFAREPAAPWERTTARWIALLLQFHLGRVRELSESTEELLREAEERGDLQLQACVLGGPGQYHWIARDRPDELRERLTRVMSEWSQRGFQLQHHFELWALTVVDLYQGRARNAVERIERAWPTIQRSPLMRARVVAATVWWLRATAHVALAEQIDERKERRRLLRRARRSLRKLQCLDQPCFAPMVPSLRAGIANLEGDSARADALLEEALALGDKHELHSAELLYRCMRGELCADDAEVRRGAAEARRYLEEQGVVDVMRCAHTFVPGFANLRQS